MNLETLVQHLAVLIVHGHRFVQPGLAADSHAEMVASYRHDLNRIGTLGDAVASLVEKGVATDLASPLAFAKLAEETHMALLELDVDEKVWTGQFELGLANTVFAVCCENGVDLENDGGHCLKATPIEVCQYNLQRIAGKSPV